MEGGVRVCGDAVLRHFLILSWGIAVLQNQAVGDIKKFSRVISMRLAVFLCCSMRSLHGIRCSFAVFVLPLRSPRHGFSFLVK